MEDNKKNSIEPSHQNPNDKSLENNASISKAENKKRAFGTIKPLTALQIISLMVPSNPASAGNCY